MGVPDHVCDEYVTKSKKVKNRNHGFVVGVADPTSELPPGTIFVTGFFVKRSISELFVTRSPCVERSDGCMLPVVTSKPLSMSQSNWEWLQTLPFGAIMFATPPQGIQPIPLQIASGDLDGDLYFICWDPQILSYVQAEPFSMTPLPETEMEEEPPLSEDPYDPMWLSKAQRLMTDAPVILDLQALVGKLYSTAEKIANKSSKFMDDEDAIAFAKAYKQALDLGKHGGQISLPHHLQHHLPERYHKFLLADDDNES